MQNTVKLISQHAVLLVCKLQYLLSQNKVYLFLQTTLLFSVSKYSFAHSAKYPKKQFYLFHKLQFFFGVAKYCQNTIGRLAPHLYYLSQSAQHLLVIRWNE